MDVWERAGHVISVAQHWNLRSIHTIRNNTDTERTISGPGFHIDLRHIGPSLLLLEEDTIEQKTRHFLKFPFFAWKEDRRGIFSLERINGWWGFFISTSEWQSTNSVFLLMKVQDVLAKQNISLREAITPTKNHSLLLSNYPIINISERKDLF
jgi:hypothetical protein